MISPGGFKRSRSRLHRYKCSPVFALVGRFVASQERGRVRIAAPEIWSVFGPLFGAPKAGQEKLVGSQAPHQAHFCPQCGQFQSSF